MSVARSLPGVGLSKWMAKAEVAPAPVKASTNADATIRCPILRRIICFLLLGCGCSPRSCCHFSRVMRPIGYGLALALVAGLVQLRFCLVLGGFSLVELVLDLALLARGPRAQFIPRLIQVLRAVAEQSLRVGAIVTKDGLSLIDACLRKGDPQLFAL